VIQSRYEMVRLAKTDKTPIAKAAETFHFKSRSSYYLFARVLREEGFVGLFDLRPVKGNRGGTRPANVAPLQAVGTPRCRTRPAASVWTPSSGPWRNAFHGLQHKHRGLFVQIVRALAEGNGVRGTSRIFDVDKNTVLAYLRRAGQQCRRVTDRLVRGLHVQEAQLDEMWSFVEKKEKHLTEEEYRSGLKGDQWAWGVLDACTKVLVQYEIGRRTYRLALDLLRHFRERTDGRPPGLITSDEYPGYPAALLEVYGVGARGTRKRPPPEMDYAVVSKTRKKGRVVAIDVKVVFGQADRIEKKLQDSPVSRAVNVAFIERSHLSRRQFNRRLTRRTLGFSKKLRNHLWHYELETAVHNFVRPHRALQKRTPMMAAGKTDHPWSVEELLAFTPQ